ncbi:MAG: hypothetical protein IJ334_08145 [Clostridia bacterium]|nr:hypothetical protein [Clostridia bacterium]
MKNELNRKIRKLCDSAGSAAAAAKYDELTKQMNADYDARIKAGMSEIDAYRDVLRDVDKIQELLNSLPKTEEDDERISLQKSYKWLSKNLSRISGCMWIATAIVYLLFSMTYGGWEITWLIFLWTTIGQIVLNMVKKYNRGVKLKKVLKGGLSGILWIAVTILYFLFSMIVGYWHLSWLIFPFTVILQIILNALFSD